MVVDVGIGWCCSMLYLPCRVYFDYRRDGRLMLNVKPRALHKGNGIISLVELRRLPKSLGLIVAIDSLASVFGLTDVNNRLSTVFAVTVVTLAPVRRRCDVG